MLNYIWRRVLTMIPTLLVISLLVFVIIQLPPVAGNQFTGLRDYSIAAR